MNYYRERTGGVAHVPRMAYNIYKKNFEEPTVGEGFASVTHVNFVPHFEDAQAEEEFQQFV